MKIGDIIRSGPNAETKIGHSLPISKIPVGSFIYKATQKSVNLVQKDYYQQELEYDKHLAKIKRSRPFKQQVNLRQEGEFLKFSVNLMPAKC